ncbi:hypothetical protein HBH79_109000 [Parastagonospora nodorum]|nr:hypothetical protein HBH43_136360 [Parastagonospora nodorum]KAH4426299.1 hypothetical protein HBH99_030340 [Parastagonospora nodorum]KAH4566111.1 hypothetical protein HBH84_146710 [Parastagonospora nodorum]KAH4590608.1 hypothetical protein HBH83_085010 [Parastagonospora nodorum]KAH4663456.1 hypothetical protein HBH80_121680 [Parastagonospora nodorum]
MSPGRLLNFAIETLYHCVCVFPPHPRLLGRLLVAKCIFASLTLFWLAVGSAVFHLPPVAPLPSILSRCTASPSTNGLEEHHKKTNIAPLVVLPKLWPGNAYHKSIVLTNEAFAPLQPRQTSWTVLR